MTSAAGDAEAAVRTAQAYLDAGSYRRAREVLSSALAIAPDNPELLLQSACASVGLGDHIGAERRAYAVLHFQPGNAGAIRMYALALRGQGRLREAEWWAWRAAYGDPGNHWSRRVYAEILYEIGRLREAEIEVAEAIRLNPFDPDHFVLRGNIFRQMRRFDESDADYQEALRLRPDHAFATNNLAVNRLAKGRLRSALRGFLGAGGLDPGVGDLARRNIAVVATQMLRRCTWASLALIWALMQLGIAGQDGRSTVGWRVVIGVLTVGLGIAFGRFGYSVPYRTGVAVLKLRPVLGLRVILIGCAIVLGVLGTLAGPIGVVFKGAAVLLLWTVLLVVLGRFTRQ